MNNNPIPPFASIRIRSAPVRWPCLIVYQKKHGFYCNKSVKSVQAMNTALKSTIFVVSMWRHFSLFRVRDFDHWAWLSLSLGTSMKMPWMGRNVVRNLPWKCPNEMRPQSTSRWPGMPGYAWCLNAEPLVAASSSLFLES